MIFSRNPVSQPDISDNPASQNGKRKLSMHCRVSCDYQPKYASDTFYKVELSYKFLLKKVVSTLVFFLV